MIVSWNWLKEYVRLDMSIDTLVDRLMMSGLNHESTEEVAGDLAIDLEVTSNRPDCLGHIGIAREIAVLFDRELQWPSTEFEESQTAIEELTSVVVEPDAASWCPQYRARVIENIQVGPSPEWMQRRLRSLGQQPVNNVVDITNYVLFECGQPLHAFDYDKLMAQRIVVRNARQEERFVAINNKTYTLQPSMGVIADAERAVAIAGVMGGADTEVSESTTRVLLETAEFAPLVVRHGSRLLDLSSASSYRFERKIDPAGVVWASDRACHLLCKLAGGRVAKGAIHVGTNRYTRDPIRLRWQRVPKILGIDISKEEICRILDKLGLAIVTQDDEAVTVLPPTFRRDLTREIDLVEEVGRIHGYDAVPEDRVVPLAVAARSKQDRVQEVIRQSLCASGYHEAVTFSFTEDKVATGVRAWTDQPSLQVSHSSRKQENCLRQSLIPSLLRVLANNRAHGNVDVQLFEIAQLYIPKPGQQLPEDPSVVGLVSQVTGDLETAVRLVRGHVESLLDRLHIQVVLSPCTVEGLEAGKTAEWLVDGQRVGILGLANRELKKTADLNDDAVVAELLVDVLTAKADLVAKAHDIPTQPAAVRDLAIVLDESTTWADLESTVRSVAPPELETLEFVDLYRGKQVPDGKKSIAFRLIYRAADRTLTREEVEAHQQRIIQTIADRLQGTLRT